MGWCVPLRFGGRFGVDGVSPGLFCRGALQIADHLVQQEHFRTRIFPLRIEICGDETVRVCRHGESIGKVVEPMDVLRARLVEIATRARLRRARGNGRTCVPSCPFPGMPEARYCELFDQRSLTFREAIVQSRLRGILTYARDEYE